MSLLYALKPEGVGSRRCEGLVSYLCRLANAHTVSVDDLVNGALGDISATDFRIWRHFSFWNRSNAVSLYTKARTLPLQDALYRATEVNEVQRLSLASLADVIDVAGMAATEPRHCAACYLAVPYPMAFRPLLWDVGVVTVCPQHLCALVPSRCGAPSSRQRARWSRRQVPGVCPTCGALNYECRADPPPRAASFDEVWVAEQTGAMIAAVSAGQRFDADAVRRAVYEMAAIVGGGRPFRAARKCGFSKARLFDWIHGRRLVKYKPLLALCAAAGVDVVDAMQGSVSQGTGCPYRYVPRSSNGGRVPYSERLQLLQRFSADDGRPSLSLVARMLKVSTRTLTKAFPEETALIIARHREHVLSGRLLRTDETKKKLEEIVGRLVDGGRSPTLRNVWLEGGIMVTPNSRYMVALQRILEAGRTESTTTFCRGAVNDDAE
ncbi:TniQ family protein [Paraburkholderia sp. MM5477-R1]|uniref:TniQ family protein n=1 Tax=Paraburkholderia sp. MM5477-R1 TaxID=2991062 RepID=UPI003D246A4F